MICLYCRAGAQARPSGVASAVYVAGWAGRLLESALQTALQPECLELDFWLFEDLEYNNCKLADLRKVVHVFCSTDFVPVGESS